jgi:nucleoid-associated protein YgaU
MTRLTSSLPAPSTLNGGLAPAASLPLSPSSLASPPALPPLAQDALNMSERVMPEASASFIEHRVKRGENLSEIAQQYLGDANRYPLIFEANRASLSNPDALRVGMTLTIPLPSQVPATPGEVSAILSPPEPESNFVQHRVKRGESLSDIAQQHLGNPNRFPEIFNLNRSDLRNPNDLRIGMMLKVPVPPEPQTPTPASPSVPVAPAAPVASVPAAPAAPATPTLSPLPVHYTQYTVQRGESLSAIALNQLGDSERYMEIFNANTDRLKSPDALKPGMTLNIPVRNQAHSSTPSRTPSVAPVAAVDNTEGLSPRATELLGAMQRYQQYHAALGNTQRARTTPAQMREIAVELDKSAQAFGVDPKMMLALFAHESGGINPRARSHTGAGGLGQLTGIAIRQVHHMSGIAKGFRGESPYNQYKGNFVQSTRSINPRYDIKANVWTSVAYMSYELNDRSHLGGGIKNALKRYGDPNVPTYANKVNAEYKTLFGGSLF